jgi:hypothetical protein
MPTLKQYGADIGASGGWTRLAARAFDPKAVWGAARHLGGTRLPAEGEDQGPAEAGRLKTSYFARGQVWLTPVAGWPAVSLAKV